MRRTASFIQASLLLCLIVAANILPARAGGVLPAPALPTAKTYYVSSSQGNDHNTGLSESDPLATISTVNSLALQPGDVVLFKCGDTWRADPLILKHSGAAGQPILFSSYPAACLDRPVLSGAQPVAGWQLHTGSIYIADLSTGANQGKFTDGINQLFRAGERLTLGRWPNLDAPDGGYSTIDNQPAGNQLTDNQLPAGSWTGAVAHIRGMRWYILNRLVTGTSGQTLSLGTNLDCWGNNCTGWGYFINNHINTLDRDGEWYYDPLTRHVYLYSSTGVPADGQVEGSVILHPDDRSWGGILLGEDYQAAIAYVTVDNLAIHGWFRHGIATPTNLHPYENHHVTLQNNALTDMDGTGINLATWVYDAGDGRPDGWRGGYEIIVKNNLIAGANQMGINSYARNLQITNNVIREVGLIENLNAAGLGCSFEDGEGACTEDGDGIRIKIDQANDTGNYTTISGNRLERIAHNGMDIFGHHNTIKNNVIVQSCFTKGDCGGVRTFGRDNLDTSAVHDLTFEGNIILNTIGNTDGCQSAYDALFGFGLYIDNYSRDINITGNTIVSSTAAGILYQNSTGAITSNTLYNNSRGSMYSAQVTLTEAPTFISQHSSNILFSLQPNAWTLFAAGKERLGASDHNDFFHPYQSDHIQVEGSKTMAEWQAFSGFDLHSRESWFHLAPADPPNSIILYNDTPQTKTLSLGNTLYRDLDRNIVYGSLALAPYQSKILIASGEVADLALTMQLVSLPETTPGAPVTYTLTVANLGTAAATQVTLTNPIPAEIINTEWQASSGAVAAQSGARYVWNLPDLAAVASVTVTVTGSIAATLEAGTALALAAQATTQSPEANTANNHFLLELGRWWLLYLPFTRR